jgi:hypothetical protein
VGTDGRIRLPDTSPFVPQSGPAVGSDEFSGRVGYADHLGHHAAALAGATENLSRSLERIPSSITMQGTHTHAVHHYGLDGAAGKVSEAVEGMLTRVVEAQINKFARRHLPDAGPFT